MKVIFLDNDGVMCLVDNWGSRFFKREKYAKETNPPPHASLDIIFDDFDQKCVKVLNSILEETGAKIVISSDWKLHAPLETLQKYYFLQGVSSYPIDITPDKKVYHMSMLESTREDEIMEWLENHPEVTHWVAVDDMLLKGLTNFVHTPQSFEGIKQTGIKEKILKYLE